MPNSFEPVTEDVNGPVRVPVCLRSAKTRNDWCGCCRRRRFRGQDDDQAQPERNYTIHQRLSCDRVREPCHHVSKNSPAQVLVLPVCCGVFFTTTSHDAQGGGSRDKAASFNILREPAPSDGRAEPGVRTLLCSSSRAATSREPKNAVACLLAEISRLSPCNWDPRAVSRLSAE